VWAGFISCLKRFNSYMCGRYTLASHDMKLPSLWTLGIGEANGAAVPVEGLLIAGDDLRPMQWISVYRCVDGRIEPAVMQWGLVPS
jgi:putative SOS response-associated peptidase YedK